MIDKYFFRIGATEFLIEYRASLAWELIRSSSSGIALKEAMQERSEIADDIVNNAFAIADAFTDKVMYRKDWKKEDIPAK